MKAKVLKFGGTSVASAEKIKQLKAIVESDPANRYIVVSAPGKRSDEDTKITDLLNLCKSQRDNKVPYDELLQTIFDRYDEIIRELGLELDLSDRYSEIRRKIESGASLDYISSRGEYLSALVISSYLAYDFVDAAGIILFDKRGRLMAEESYSAISDALAKHERAVIPGFYGTIKGSFENSTSGPDRYSEEIKIFSRGGSDISGSVVARAVNAEIYENWTDVSGLLVADPRIVDDPRQIDKISYLELRELSYTGASVLHEDAIFPVREAGIPINIRNTDEPENPGTIIDGDILDDDGRIISGIAGKKDFTVIAVHKNMMNKELGFVRRALMVLEDYDVNFDHIPTEIDTFSVVIDKKELEDKLQDVIKEFELRLDPDEIKVYDDISLIAVVGRGMKGRPGVSARILGTLADEGINLRMINQGSSEINIIIGVLADDFEKSIRLIYDEFAK